MKLFRFLFLFAVLFPFHFLGSARAATKTGIWVYSSIYKEFLTPLGKAFEEKNPDVEVQLFQAGSEKIQAKVEAEILAGTPQADILLTSDPFWSEALAERGLVASRPGHPPAEPNYYSLMIIICHQDFPAAQCPGSFKDLMKPEYKGLLQAGSPLDSGTTFSTVAALSRKYGWEYFKKLRENKLASSGGNSTVIQKVESGEKKVGIVLLENALAARKRGSPITVVYPSDGAIPIPSVQVVLKSGKNHQAAGRFADFVLSPEAQNILRAGFMYSVRKDLPPPEGAKPLDEVIRKSDQWTKATLTEVGKSAKEIKKKYSELIFE